MGHDALMVLPPRFILIVCVYAQIRHKTAIMAVRNSDSGMEARNTAFSSPRRSMVADAAISLAGPKTEASPPPMPAAAAMSRPLAPIWLAAERLRPVSMAMDELSEPLITPANNPRYGAAKA